MFLEIRSSICDHSCFILPTGDKNCSIDNTSICK